MRQAGTSSSPLQCCKGTGIGKWAAGTSCLALAVAFATPVAAQVSQSASAPGGAPPAAAPRGNNGHTIEEVVVTARRVRERLQDIPASVAAITGERVAAMATLSDLQSMVSGVTFQTFGPIPTIGIRGYGNRTQVGTALNSTVGVFEDGVFVSPPLVTLINRADIDRVEVAKGPQSTLFGRSSFTGAINVVSTDPAKKLSGYIDAGGGGSSVHGDTLWHVRGAVSVPITDTLSIRLFGTEEKRDGYTYDSVTDRHGGGYDHKIGRVRVLWHPNDIVTARLTGTIIGDNEPLAVVHSGRNIPPLGEGVLLGDPFNPAVQAAQVFGRTVWDGIYPSTLSGKTNAEQVTLDLRVKTSIGEFASLTDYQHSDQNLRLSLDLTRLNIADGYTPFNEHRFSQEFRLSNKLGRFSYIAGLYALYNTDAISGGQSVHLSEPAIVAGPGSSLYDFAGVKAIYEPSYIRTNAYAAFAQLGYDITDRLNLTLGIREGRDELSGPTAEYLQTLSDFLIPVVPRTSRKGDFNATTGSANLSYKIARDVIAYASYSRGDSPGGLNLAGAATLNYAPQKVNAYEVGLKSQLFDHHLQLDAALFDNQYTQLQLNQDVFFHGALNSLITNAAAARGRGLDIDSVAVLSDNWRVGLQYTYADSKITSYDVPLPPAPQVDFTGVPLVRSPKHSLNGSVTYSTDVGPGRLSLTAEESYTSSYTNDYQGVPAGTAYPGIPGSLLPGVTAKQVLALYRTPGYALTNLNASYSWKNWELSGYARNLFNHQYIAAVLGFDAVTYPQELPGEPQTYEISLKYKF